MKTASRLAPLVLALLVPALAPAARAEEGWREIESHRQQWPVVLAQGNGNVTYDVRSATLTYAVEFEQDTVRPRMLQILVRTWGWPAQVAFRFAGTTSTARLIERTPSKVEGVDFEYTYLLEHETRAALPGVLSVRARGVREAHARIEMREYAPAGETLDADLVGTWVLDIGASVDATLRMNGIAEEQRDRFEASFRRHVTGLTLLLGASGGFAIRKPGGTVKGGEWTYEAGKLSLLVEGRQEGAWVDGDTVHVLFPTPQLTFEGVFRRAP
jgi:hypothetical protein